MRTNLEAVLVQVKSTHNNLPRTTFTGWLQDKPVVGKSFSMTTREEGVLHTSSVKTIRFNHDGTVEFDTRNSTYQLKYMPEQSEKIYISPMENEILSILVTHGIGSKAAMAARLIELEKKLYA